MIIKNITTSKRHLSTVSLFFGRVVRVSLPLLLAGLLSSTSNAAILPSHQPLSVLIIADEVNPHQLNDADLTQPEDLAPALTASDSGLNNPTVTTVDSQCVGVALEALQSSQPPDVVLYFAHRGAVNCNGDAAQSELTKLLELGLKNGIGIVILHHGLYVDFINRGAKAELLQLIGAEADSIAWDTEQGQRVYNVAGEHFISSNGLTYASEAQFVGTAGVSENHYPYFENVPDELYSITRLHEAPGESRTPLFASDSEGERLLGYVLNRDGWDAPVVVYQPGEYQPNALDNKSGPNFQILVNALYFAALGEAGIEGRVEERVEGN